MVEYDVSRHIEAVSEAAKNCSRLVIGLEAVLPPQHPGQDWHGQQLRGLMEAFCTIDLGWALPSDPKMRGASMQHLVLAHEALAHEDHPRRGEFLAVYERFDKAARPFYTSYAKAFGGTVSDEMISATNGCVDREVRLGNEDINKGHPYMLVLQGIVRAVTEERHRILVPQESRWQGGFTGSPHGLG